MTENPQKSKKTRHNLKPHIDVDRISDLPDAILIHILSLIPLTHVIQTATVSKRWFHLCSSLPYLFFRFNKNSGEWDSETQFISFVDKALIQFNPNDNTLHRFCVVFDYEVVRHKKKVDSWVRSALNRNVKELELQFHDVGNFEIHAHQYDIPSFLWQDEVITRLNLKQCRLWSNSNVGTCKSLRSLSFTLCSLTGLSEVSADCPVLERLELLHCCVYYDLNIIHDRLKELVIESVCRPRVTNGLFEISAPRLKSLSITGKLEFAKCRVRNVSSLVEAYIDFNCEGSAEKLEHGKGMIVEDMLASLGHVKKLTIGSCFN